MDRGTGVDVVEDAEPGERRRTGPLLAMIGLAALLSGLIVASGALSRVGYAAQLAGTPGTLTVAACHADPRDDVPSVCEGTFVADAGGPGRFASIHAKRPPGTRMQVQRNSVGGYVEVGFAPVAGWLAVACLALLLADIGLIGLARLSVRRTRLPRLLMLTGVALLALAVLCLLSGGLVSAVQLLAA